MEHNSQRRGSASPPCFACPNLLRGGEQMATSMTVTVQETACGSAWHRAAIATVIVQLAALCGSAAAHAEHALIVLAGNHTDPGYVSKHTELIESRPFDGMVINEYLGRNLLNTKLKADSPNSLDPSTGAVTYESAARGLSPVKGVFKKYRYNFAKVNFNLVGPPPLLNDDAGWQVVYQSAANYAKAVQDTGLKGIFLDNETYLHSLVNGRKNGDYWLYEDQIGFAQQSASAMPFSAAIALARRRGRELMQAFMRGYPGITLMAAHGADEGCEAWKQMTGHFATDRWLSGAFVGGMVEATSGGATFVDGGEDYDLRSERDFSMARGWRKGGSQAAGITNLGPGKCPFMDASLASNWNKASIAFSIFDKERVRPGANEWAPINSSEAFRATLTSALRASDQYTWLYTQWQDWWGDSMDDRLKPYIDAINAARREVGMNPN
jgi:hypothetical protein